MVHRLRVGVALRGELAGAAEVVRRLFIETGFGEMPGQLHDDIVEPVGVERLEGVADILMQVG